MKQREIKFRAWDKVDKKWLYFTLDELIKGKARLLCCLINWCEYTGLKDSKGVEIYEGDIVEYTNGIEKNKDSEGKKMIYELKWNKKDALFELDGIYLGNYFEVGKVEVIGNIYKNKDLLKN